MQLSRRMKNVSAYFVFSLFDALLYLKFQWSPILYLPMILGMLMIFRAPPQEGLLIVLSYLSIEGCFKLFSDSQIVLRLAIDILILCLFLKSWVLFHSMGKANKLVSAPFRTLFWIHVGWILVQFLNPNALGLIPSLAAYKTYISSVVLYFLAFSVVEEESDLRDMALVAIALMSLQVVTSIYQFQIGEAGMAAIHTNYINSLGDRFTGIFFRPFGTSNVPGGGTTMIYLTLPFFIYFGFLRSKPFIFLLSLVGLALIAYVLFISQVRAAMIKGLIGSVVLMVMMFWKQPRASLRIFAVVGTIIVISSLFLNFQDEKFEVARERFEALQQTNKIWESRSQGVGDSIIRVVEEAPLGIGLSRVGAGAGPFRALIEAHERYGLLWSFADNFYKALLIEIGVPGTIAFSLFIFFTFLKFVKGLLRPLQGLSFEGWGLLCATAGMLTSALVGHLGSEGFLYQPESTFFWLFLGAGMKAVVASSKSSRES